MCSADLATHATKSGRIDLSMAMRTRGGRPHIDTIDDMDGMDVRVHVRAMIC
jgi:hypothetical protein